MLSGEIKKFVRNKVFLLIVIVLLGMNLLTIMYCSNKVNPVEQEEKARSQKKYVLSYDKFINEMDLRASLLLEMQQGRVSRYFKKNIAKTLSDYNGLDQITLSNEYDIGINEYVKYRYGLYYLIIFSFLGIYTIFWHERECGLISFLRVTKKGRKQRILTNMLLYALSVAFFDVLLEATTLCAFSQIYGFKDLNAAIQSLPVLRDCFLVISIKEGIIGIVIIRIFLSIVISHIIFFFSILFSEITLSVIVPVILFGSQFVFFQILSIDSRLDYLYCLNLFCGWDMKNFFGVYHNLNVCGTPIEKNTVLFFFGMCTVGAIQLSVPVLFDKFYREQRISQSNIIANIGSHYNLLFFKQVRLFTNECHNVFFMQKKWMVVVVFLLFIFKSWDSYIDRGLQDSYEACYHLYLSNLQGPDNKQAEQYIKKQGNYLKSLQKIMQKSKEQNDTLRYEAAMAEYDSKVDGYDRIIQQRKQVIRAGKHAYWLDELHFKRIIRLYGTSIITAGISMICTILLLSGLFANRGEVRMENLIRSTKKGQRILYQKKIHLAAVIIFLLGFFMNFPLIVGLHKISAGNNFQLQLKYITDPIIPSEMTVGSFFVVILLIRWMLLLFISTCTIFLGQKNKNEFYISVFLSGVVLSVCIIMYIFKTDVALILIHIMGGICNGNYAGN